MQYLFLLYDNEDKWAAASEAEFSKVVGEHMAYSEALRKAGAYVEGAPLDHSKNARRVRGVTVEDGPYTDAKEQLGGYYRIEAKDLDAAIEWAARCPAASYGCVEVRPMELFEK